MDAFQSWGRVPRAQQTVTPLTWMSDDVPWSDFSESVLPYGLGRSYGDSCLNDGGRLLHTTPLDRFIAFDRSRGLLRCEAGVSLADVIGLVGPHGWFPPTTPGTKYVTIGGAIANDVHGKNHHRAGTFGRHVTRFELLRSDGARRLCSPTENADLFRATIGGLGLTGLILWAEIQLARVSSVFIDEEIVKFGGIGEFFDIASASDEAYEHTVAWVDCLAAGDALGRGLFMRGNFATPEAVGDKKPRPPRQLPMPIDAPGWVVNGWTVRAFNSLYFHRHRQSSRRHIVHYDPFFYPLDAIAHWNRMYGRRGFFQYQCVVPGVDDRGPITEILAAIAAARTGSMLAVLKRFGDLPSPGMMSFPRPGITLALDFPNRGEPMRRLLERLDAIVRRHGGRVYPAKDARMSAASFQEYFPQWADFQSYVDPNFSSSFWRRVTAPNG